MHECFNMKTSTVERRSRKKILRFNQLLSLRHAKRPQVCTICVYSLHLYSNYRRGRDWLSECLPCGFVLLSVCIAHFRCSEQGTTLRWLGVFLLLCHSFNPKFLICKLQSHMQLFCQNTFNFPNLRQQSMIVFFIII